MAFDCVFLFSTFNFLYKFCFVYPCKLLQKTIFFCFSFFTKKTRFCLFPFFFFFVICLEIYFSCFVKCVRFKRAICHSVVHSNGQQPLRAGRSLFQSCGQEIVAGTLHCLEGGRAHESSSLEGLLQVRAGRSSPGACQERTGCWFVYTTAQHLSSTDAAARRACSALLCQSHDRGSGKLLSPRRRKNRQAQEENNTGYKSPRSQKPCKSRNATRFLHIHFGPEEVPHSPPPRRNTTMAKEKRNGNIPEWPWPRLPHELEICRRRDAVCHLQRTDTENDVWIQEGNRESGTQDSPRQDENSQQSEQHEFWHKRYIIIGEMSIEILTRNEKREVFGPENLVPPTRDIRNQEQDQGGLATFHKYRQELTSKNYMLKHRLRLFDATVSPTICYATGTWTPNKEHERMIQSTQRKMLRFIIQTKRKYKKIEKYWAQRRNGNVDITAICSTDDESGDGQSTKSQDDVDSEVTFVRKLIHLRLKREDWIEYIKRSTADALDKMERAKIRCWNRAHKKIKWKLALRIATSPCERWLKKDAG